MLTTAAGLTVCCSVLGRYHRYILCHRHPHKPVFSLGFRVSRTSSLGPLHQFCFVSHELLVCGVILQHPRQQTPTMCSSLSLSSHSDDTHCRLSWQLHHRLVSHLYVAMGTALLVTPPSFPITHAAPPRGERGSCRGLFCVCVHACLVPRLAVTSCL